MTSRRARRGAAMVAPCLGMLLASGCGAFSGSVNQKASAAPAPTAARAAAPVVMFLGDSYTVGERGAQPETTYAAAAARLLGWQVVLAGRGGTGFLAGGKANEPFGVLFESQLGWRPAPDLLIVSGGHNDTHHPPQQVAGAARDVLDRARRRWPSTRVVLVGPIWGNETPPPRALAVRDALRDVARQQGIPFLDPIVERWITGNRIQGSGNAPDFIRRDGVHPTPAGHRHLATRLVEGVNRLGLAQPNRKS
ncbi:SGNH/GDSL hydrolase family protein [Spirillospora sp. CA-294931]|uniref:SGNH/GDSL hydrolase family protein n=1 Tax=Spirillospora sp. CA-294931 TaxID=3240042 RepID=UPI003D89F671